MTPEERLRLVEATTLAYEWHATQRRKGTEIPYVSHLLQVKGLVLEHGGDTGQAIAALLHDALEDSKSPGERGVREQEIRERFGQDVLGMVLECTDTRPDEAQGSKRPWRQRKQRYLEQLAQANERTLLVAACDKRHNLHALVWDLETQGIEYLERFHAGADDQLWFFESVVTAMQGRIPARLHAELRDLLSRLRALLDGAH